MDYLSSRPRMALHRAAQVASVLLAGLIFGFTGSMQTHAADNAFMVRPNIPTDNKAPKNSNYFQVQLKRHDSRQLGLTLYNENTQPLKVNVAVLNAITATNGRVVYVPAKQVDRKMLPRPVSELIHYPRTVTVKSRTITQLTLTVPAQAPLFRGTKAAAIQLTGQTTGGKGKAAVTNRVRYQVGLLLQGKKVTQTPQLAIGTKTWPTKLVNPRLKVQVVNANPHFIRDATFRLDVQGARALFLNYHKRVSGIKIAPNSQFQMGFGFHGARLQSGYYRLQLHVSGTAHKQTMTRFIRVSRGGDITYVAQRDYQLARRWLWLVLGGIVLVVAALVTWLLVVRARRRKNHASSH